MPIINQNPLTFSSTLNKRLRALRGFAFPEPYDGEVANENVYSSQAKILAGGLLKPDNHTVLVEDRPYNVYGDDCIECRETYRKADEQSRAMTITGVKRQDSII